MLIKSCLVALGFVSTMAIASSAPALAQGGSIHRPGVSLHSGHQDRISRAAAGRRGDRSSERADRDSGSRCLW